MWSVKQPSEIIFRNNCAKEFLYPKKCLGNTSKGARSHGWLEYTGLKEQKIFDQVEPNPSMETVQKIISEYSKTDFSHITGIGGGSSLDVAKFCAYKMKKLEIMTRRTFGRGSEGTRT